jgi:hypothetical protein
MPGGRLAWGLVLGLVWLAASVSPARAEVMLAPPFQASYTLRDLGSVPGLPASYGGLTLLAGNPNVLLIGGDANTAGGALYSVNVVRDAQNHIVGFSGPATRFADAPFNDGGVVYGPGGVLFLARWPSNELGQIRPGATTTGRVIDLAPFGVTNSLSALNFIPPGYPGEGGVRLVSWPSGDWYHATLMPDGTGLFNVASVTPVPTSNLPGGPEGFVYVPFGSPVFGSTPTMLLAEYSANQVTAYDLNATGDPIVSTRRTFVTGLTGAEGAFIDPVTGDFLFTTFGGGDRVIVVQGFVPPPAVVPEPGSLTLLSLGVVGLAGYRWKRARRKS